MTIVMHMIDWVDSKVIEPSLDGGINVITIRNIKYMRKF